MTESKIQYHLAGLLRARVIVSLLGIVAMCFRPEIAISITAVVGFACGVSLADSLKGKVDGQK